MLQIKCPSCGGSINFISNSSLYATCTYCTSLVVRSDLNVELIGKVSEIQDDLSPFKIGSEIDFEGERFHLLGRSRWSWDDGFWNEWFIQGNSGRQGWLVEAQGSYAVCFEVFGSSASTINAQYQDFLKTPEKDLNRYESDFKITIEGAELFLTDKKSAKCISFQGELPFIAELNIEIQSFDFMGQIGEFASFQIEQELPKLFAGRYLDWRELNAANIKTFDENYFTQRLETAKTFNCPKCGGVIRLKLAGISTTAACTHCTSIIDVADNNLKLVEKYEGANFETFLEIGTRGKLLNIAWEIIGVVIKTEETGFYEWTEYLLFNNYHGFSFLIFENGHWSIIKVLRQKVLVSGQQTINFENKEYQLFLCGKAIVKQVKGEFYWRVRRGESVDVQDYINPPNLFSIEFNSTEVNQSLGEYLSPGEIKIGFELPTEPPTPIGVAANQPNLAYLQSRKAWSTYFKFLIFAVVVQLFFAARAQNKEVLNFNWSVSAEDKNYSLGSDYFEVTGRTSNIYIQTTATVNNNWSQVEISLINKAGEEVGTVNYPIEFYYGNDSDGSWSEGATSNYGYISAVPAGKYKVVLEGEVGTGRIDFTTSIKRDVLSWSLFWWYQFLILIYPVYMMFKSYSFERTRWSQSDYAPAKYGSISSNGGVGDNNSESE